MLPTPILPARRHLLTAAAVLAASALLPFAANAYDENSTKAVNVDTSGLAPKGHDPVAYFTASRATPGLPQFNASFGGATYRFASSANRDAFVADPAQYVPAYGGSCAMGVALENF